MTPPRLAIVLVAAILVNSCRGPNRLYYADKADAGSETVFARGWLPEVIPDSSREIEIYNELDQNTSVGQFRFDQSDVDLFKTKLQRTAQHDVGTSYAYTYSDWTFWISGDSNVCRFNLGITQRNE